jgi:thiamine biosynthesis lipoprotein
MISVDKLLYKYLLVFSTAFIVLSCAPESKFKILSFTGNTMGTTYSVKIVDSLNFNITQDYLKFKVDSILNEVNRQMSTYIPTSEISQFNNSSSLDWQEVSYDFAFVVEATKKIGLETDGASDFTLGPLVNLWGFGPNYIPDRIPTEDEIKAAKEKTGLNKIHVKYEPASLKKDQIDIYCDLSSTAKGFGVDKVAEYIYSIGYKNYLVEIGGEVTVKGINQSGQPWKIGISTPDISGNLQRTIDLKDMSLATSGDYWNYYEKEGIRYSHLIDSETGKPISHNLASVTVIHSSCMMADGYATAINVMGQEKGLAFADKMKLPVLLIVREDNEFVVFESDSFTNFVSEKE